jgi:two-component SAPR family response regulator
MIVELLKILVVDDEMAALNTFLPSIWSTERISNIRCFVIILKGRSTTPKTIECEAAFLDIAMPKMNGVDLAKALIKETLRPFTIFFITSYTFDEEGTARGLRQEFRWLLLQALRARRDHVKQT